MSLNLNVVKLGVCGAIGLLALITYAKPQNFACTQWNDAQSNIAFPESAVDLKMRMRTVDSDNCYTLVYMNKAWLEGKPNQDLLSVCIFSVDSVRLDYDGVGPEVDDEVRREITNFSSMLKDPKDAKLLRPIKEHRVKLPESGLEVVVATTVVHTKNNPPNGLCVVLLTAYKGQFLELRYFEGMQEPLNEETKKWRQIVSWLDGLIKKSADDRAVDVYAIKDDAKRLAALKRKWVAAGDQLPVWNLMKSEKLSRQFRDMQGWCVEDRANRYNEFEELSRRAIALKLNPPGWYYNLACAQAYAGRPDEAILSLEQAVAAGYCDDEWARKDEDLESIAKDARFAALCGAMRAAEPETLEKIHAKEDGSCIITAKNLNYDDEVYLPRGIIEAANTNAIVYLNRHKDHPDIPAEGLICPLYEKAAKDKGLDKGPMNILFNGWPTIGASDYRFGEEENLIGETASIPAVLGTCREKANQATELVLREELGVYAVGDDYGMDGVDRLVGYFPWCVAHEGGAEESDKFVRLLATMMKLMPRTKEDNLAFASLDILRRSQKCVKSEQDLLKGIAQRPVLRYEDIDVKRATDLARTMKTFVAPPAFADVGNDPDWELSLGGDLRDAPWVRMLQSITDANAILLANWIEYTGKFTVKAIAADDKCERFEWRVLQGDPKKVRIVPQDPTNSLVKIEVDYHEAFDAELPGDRKILTTRVDIGCFAVAGGRFSTPIILSVFYNPNEKREYDANHRLVSINYTQRQIQNFCPYIGIKGDWKDVFAYSDGKMSGWERYFDNGDGTVTTNRFTRGGLVIDTVDALGRPKDVHRSNRSTWIQNVNATNLVGRDERKVQILGYFSTQENEKEGSPREATLAWEFKYKDDEDRIGTPHSKAPTSFHYRPELCRRADFSDESGFRFPLFYQMNEGYNQHAAYRHDIPDEDVAGLLREDSKYALKALGLTPPNPLKKMRFCPWVASTNDAWTCDMLPDEEKCEARLIELADGVYRRKHADDDDCFSVAGTSRAVNRYLAAQAFKQLDARYPRCSAAEIKKLFGDKVEEEYWATVFVCDGGFLTLDDVPEDKHELVAMWRIRKDLVISVLIYRDSNGGIWQYDFGTIDPATGLATGRNTFMELPSTAIGNTVLRMLDDEPEALNNFAVLYYCGVANFGDYSEEKVIVFLEAAARGGCATAKYNLGVLYENRGEKYEAARYYEEARVMGYKDEKDTERK